MVLVRSGGHDSLHSMYVYRARCTYVVDGDTVDLLIDVGFKMTTHQRIRLVGVDTYELRDKDGVKRELAKQGKAAVQKYLIDHQNDKSVTDAIERLGGETTEEYPLLIHTTKSDSFGRWLARIYFMPFGSEEPVELGQQLLDDGLAVPYTK